MTKNHSIHRTSPVARGKLTTTACPPEAGRPPRGIARPSRPACPSGARGGCAHAATGAQVCLSSLASALYGGPSGFALRDQTGPRVLGGAGSPAPCPALGTRAHPGPIGCPPSPCRGHWGPGHGAETDSRRAVCLANCGRRVWPPRGPPWHASPGGGGNGLSPRPMTLERGHVSQQGPVWAGRGQGPGWVCVGVTHQPVPGSPPCLRGVQGAGGGLRAPEGLGLAADSFVVLCLAGCGSSQEGGPVTACGRAAGEEVFGGRGAWGAWGLACREPQHQGPLSPGQAAACGVDTAPRSRDPRPARSAPSPEAR